MGEFTFLYANLIVKLCNLVAYTSAFFPITFSKSKQIKTEYRLKLGSFINMKLVITLSEMKNHRSLIINCSKKWSLPNKTSMRWKIIFIDKACACWAFQRNVMGINLIEPLKEFLRVGSDLPAKSLTVKMLFCFP